MKKNQNEYMEEKRKNPKKESVFEILRNPKTCIIFSAGFFSFLFIAMIGYVCYYINTHQVAMMNNSYNAGQTILMTQNTRGTIYARGGEVLAESKAGTGKTDVRTYPYQNVFSHVVGYAVKGMSGIESLANFYLLQSDIPISEQIGNSQENKKNPGDNVYSTLDVKLQNAAYDALGICKGAIIVTNPKTGEILAMVSKPDFNPEDISADWKDLVADSSSSALLNRCTQGLYPPGSTFKIITALEYIRENPSSYMDYQFQCKGSVTIDGTKIQCYHGIHHGKVDFTESFAKSCNSSFANISTKLNWNLFTQTSSELLFGKTLPFQMKTSISRMKTGSGMSTEDKMETGIGQGETVVTPLHMNMITCAIANKGVLQNPYLMSKVVSHSGETIKTFSSDGQETLMTNQEAEVLRGMMKAVVNEGTASKLSGLSYTAAGKTGSAEFDDESDSHAWFTGFAPADNPQICVTVIIEGAGSGGDFAVPAAKKIFNAYFNA
jgi:peptidoglycan glycosyltransferase